MPASHASEVRRDLAGLLLPLAILFLVQLGARDLWNPNEPLYGRAVVEMFRSGDWLVPTVNGEVFGEKPILYFWMALSAGHLRGGVDELGLRLPSAVAALVGVAFVYLLVRPYAGGRRARVASLLFGTTFIVFWSARSVQMDLLLAVCTLGAVLAVTRVLDHGARPRVGWGLAGLAAGLGLLAKGPVGLICPGLVVLAYAATTRRLSALRLTHLGLAATVCVAVAAPWYLLLVVTDQGALLHEVLIRQNFTRFIAPWDHAEPWWYYLFYFWIDMAPWSLLVPFAVALPQPRSDERRLDLLAWVWVFAIVVFFSLSASKRSPYILPVAPAVAVLASSPVLRLIEGRLDRRRMVAMACLLAVLGLVFVATGVYLQRVVVEEYAAIGNAGRATVILFVVAGGAVLLGLAVHRRFATAAPAAFFAAVVSLYLLAAVWVLPAMNSYKSARPFCRKLEAVVAERPLRSYRFWKWRASYVYYADRPIPRLESVDELQSYWDRRDQVFLLVERAKVEESRAVLGDVAPLVADEIGSNEVFLFTNR